MGAFFRESNEGHYYTNKHDFEKQKIAITINTKL
jgi:hypothetical protein